jgi:hypothetical protein
VGWSRWRDSLTLHFMEKTCVLNRPETKGKMSIARHNKMVQQL